MVSLAKRSVASCFMCRSRVDGKKRTGQVLFLRPRHDDVLKAERAGRCTWSPPAPRPFLASSPSRVCRFRGGRQRVHRVLLVSSVYHKPSTRGQYTNGKHLDREREKTASRTACGFAQTLHVQSGQKRSSCPWLGTPHLPASCDT